MLTNAIDTLEYNLSVLIDLQQQIDQQVNIRPKQVFLQSFDNSQQNPDLLDMQILDEAHITIGNVQDIQTMQTQMIQQVHSILKQTQWITHSIVQQKQVQQMLPQQSSKAAMLTVQIDEKAKQVLHDIHKFDVHKQHSMLLLKQVMTQLPKQSDIRQPDNFKKKVKLQFLQPSLIDDDQKEFKQKMQMKQALKRQNKEQPDKSQVSPRQLFLDKVFG